MNNENRIKLEKRIVRKAINKILALGDVQISVEDGYEELLEATTNKKKILANIFNLDDAFVYVYRQNHIELIRFTFGNDGYDVIADYSCSLEEILKDVFKYAETYA